MQHAEVELGRTLRSPGRSEAIKFAVDIRTSGYPFRLVWLVRKLTLSVAYLWTVMRDEPGLGGWEEVCVFTVYMH